MEFETILWIIIILLAIYALKAYAPQAYQALDTVLSKSFSVLANWVTGMFDKSTTEKTTTTTEVTDNGNSYPSP